jgi:gamma-D-glutamyl-L-lysine dipeptidyl-peptidase
VSSRHGYAIHNVVPMRAAPKTASEQISQLIMGDEVDVLEARTGFARVRGRDAYDGWVLASHLRLCGERELLTAQCPVADLRRVAAPFADVVSPEGDLITRLVFGTVLRIGAPVRPGRAVVTILPGGREGVIDASAIRTFDELAAGPASMCSVARSFLGTPYLWGGTTPFGFDCSGLVQRVYSAAGVTIPRDAYLQAASPLGTRLDIDVPLQACDLVFFCGASDPHGRGITHVGMMIDNARMIHAYGKTGVTIHPLQDAEIVATYAFRGAWRLEPAAERPLVGYNPATSSSPGDDRDRRK